MKVYRCGLVLWLAGCAWFFAVPAGHAAVNSWTWGGGGFWSAATNWSFLSAPGTNSSAVQFAASGLSKTVIIDSSSSPTNLIINGLIVSSTGSKSNWLVVSNLGAANPFRILAGASIGGPANNQGRLIVTNSTVILDGTNGNGGLGVSNGLVIIQSGGELQFTNGAMATIGQGDVGLLNVLTNGALRVALSNLVVGGDINGIGTMTVAGGTVDVGFTFTIGDDMTSTGTVVVAGGLLRAASTNANTEIGQHGGGQLTLSNGVCQFDDVSVGRHLGSHGTFRIFNGLCTASDLSVGRFDASYGVFSMAGGQLILDGILFAGRESTGTVSVTGGTIQAKKFIAAVTNGTLATATFSGGTSVFSAEISIGSLGSTGLVTVSGGVLICTNAASTARVDVVGGSLTITNNANVFFDTLAVTNQRGRIFLGSGNVTADQIIISNNLPFTVGGGTNVVTLRLSGGVNRFDNGLIVASNSTVIGDGVIYGNIINNGTIIADRTNTTLIFYGSVTNSRTMLQTNGGTFDFRGALVNNGTIIPKILSPSRITDFRRTGTTNRISFTTLTGLTYSVEAALSLTNSSWFTITNNFPGNNAANFINDGTATNPSRFYRIKGQ